MPSVLWMQTCAPVVASELHWTLLHNRSRNSHTDVGSTVCIQVFDPVLSTLVPAQLAIQQGSWSGTWKRNLGFDIGMLPSRALIASRLAISVGGGEDGMPEWAVVIHNRPFFLVEDTKCCLMTLAGIEFLRRDLVKINIFENERTYKIKKMTQFITFASWRRNVANKNFKNLVTPPSLGNYWG